MSGHLFRPPRYLPETPFPPYAYVPGRHPHPVRDPAGHMYGQEDLPPYAVEPAHWRDCKAFLHGVDLFNHGYYWEAHEAWEGLWRAYPPESNAARLLQGLIKLAAAGVKAREGRARGVSRHAARARALFAGLPEEANLFGVSPDKLAAAAARLTTEPPGPELDGLKLVLRPE